MNSANAAALSIQNLKVYFPIQKGIFGKTVGHVKAVDDISFDVARGEVFALVGESGCGKSTTAKAALGLVDITAGDIKLALGKWQQSPASLGELEAYERRQIRKHIQIVFQDPFSSLDPRMTVRQIIEEPLKLHRINNTVRRITELLDQVGLSSSYLNRYPHEFSGGQQQRIAIARSLATKPEMIIADEPVSALDVSIQAQIINLLDDLRQQYNLSMLFISHDLAVVRHIANRMAVMYLGKIMEQGTNEQIYTEPKHPYTHILMESIPVPGKGRKTRRNLGPEEKQIIKAGKGCPFYPRCSKKTPECVAGPIELKDIGCGHLAACIHID